MNTISPSTSSEPIAVGAKAPAVSGTTETGKRIAFADIYAQGFTLVYFFPKADTPGCTAQACSLRDAQEELKDHGVTILGVSPDDEKTQKSFKKKNQLPFTLIADTDRKILRAFGQRSSTSVMRQAYLIDSDGEVVWRDLNASTQQQAEDVLTALTRLQSPAS